MIKARFRQNESPSIGLINKTSIILKKIVNF